MNALDDRLTRAVGRLRESVDAADVPPRRGERAPRWPLPAAAALILATTAGVLWFDRSAGDEIRPAEPAGTVDELTPTVAALTTLPSTTPARAVDRSELVSDTMPRAVSPISSDASTFIDAEFGTTITRVTRADIGEIMSPVDSGTQTFNADGTKALLYRTGANGGSHVVVDTTTWKEIAVVDLGDATDIEDVTWDPSDPNLLRFVDAVEATVVAVDARTGDRTVAHRFDRCDAVDFADSHGSLGAGTPLVVVRCGSGETQSWIVYDALSDREVARRSAEPGARTVPVPLRSGRGFVLIEADRVTVLDTGLDPTGVTVDVEVSTGALALDGGVDVLVATVFDDLDGDSIGTAVRIDLATGEQQVLAGPSTGHPYPPSGTTMSPAASSTAPLVAISTSPGSSTPRSSGPLGVLDDEVLLVDLSSDTTYRLAHHRMSDADSFGAWSTPMVAVSPDGRTVLFSSNLGGDRVDTYAIDLD